MSRIKRTNQTPDTDQSTGIVSHLTELRSRLLKIFLSVGLLTLALFPFANQLYEYLSAPLMRFLPDSSSMIAIEVASPFLTPFKLTLLTAIVISIPYLLYQSWAFVAPGLYRQEQRITLPLLVSSTALFYTGMAFAYFVVFPLIFGFFTAVAPSGVAVMTDIGRYLDFVIKIFIAFGLAFEVPVATVLLVKLGTVTPQQLAHGRPYIIVGAFILGMMLTPPDVLSQILLAVPIWILFELGLVLSRFVSKEKSDED